MEIYVAVGCFRLGFEEENFWVWWKFLRSNWGGRRNWIVRARRNGIFSHRKRELGEEKNWRWERKAKVEMTTFPLRKRKGESFLKREMSAKGLLSLFPQFLDLGNDKIKKETEIYLILIQFSWILGVNRANSRFLCKI